MNIDKLKKAEEIFMIKYPGGFQNPEMIEMGKKHKMGKMIEFTQTNFSKTEFKNLDKILENSIKVVSRSSMVSMFEKPKFKSFINSFSPEEKKIFCKNLEILFHKNQKKGFESLVEMLKNSKLAKWSLISIFGAYFKPDYDVFVKPTTAKGVIKHFDLEELLYKPSPTWEFYEKYRGTINLMKTKVDKNLSPSNAAFSGFLMMSFDSIYEVS